ncbi:hypothetical protein H4P12_07590 [Paracoccus sp. 11-3]|uniref:Uncharacterized protein n=1 Tax=Paracoccus amoyensis TaxID=2760093 RepID=A0A926GME5_9RHOB|nr:hypothetical protein [Paracoccus amoyensis]MBC9246575.1 hypothetical protein [Paracoccus amoyensis]
MTQSPTAAEWSLALAPGETIIWMGQPVGQPKADGNTTFLWIFGAIFFGMGLLFLILGLVVQGQDVMFIAAFCGIGGLFALVGGGILIIPLLVRRKRFAVMRYALTDRRALIYDGTAIKDWDITPDMQFDVHPGSPGSLIFGQESLNYDINGQPAYRDVGFINITDIVEVGNMIRDIQTRNLSQVEARS